MESAIDIFTASANPQFQELWGVCKDKIDICKVCEYRYMCNDPRIPLQRQDGTYYYPTECSYNPYIAKWANEPGYHTLAECGIICNNIGLSIDENQLAAIDATINQP